MGPTYRLTIEELEGEAWQLIARCEEEEAVLYAEGLGGRAAVERGQDHRHP